MSFTDELAAWLAAGFGLQLAVFGKGAVDAVIGSRCRALDLNDPRDYPPCWRRDKAERMALLDQLLVGETWLFREWPAFALLGEWLGQRRQQFSTAAPLRILTLPCATGEEAWSIAAVVHESGLPAAAALIEAMDISPSALRRAAEGRYPQRKLRSQPLARWAHVLHPEDGAMLRVHDALRAMVRFIEANAIDSDFLLARPPYHIIFCRNLMIYMSSAARDRVCVTLGHCLAPEGILFLGNAEQAPAGSGLTRKPGEGAFAWRREDSMAPASRPPSISKPPVSTRAAAPSRAVAPMASAIPATPSVLSLPRRAPAQNPEESGTDLPAIRRLADQGHYEQALQGLASPAARQSLDPAVHSLAGVLLGALGRKDEAMTRFRQALYLDPSHPESLAHLALLLDESGDALAAARLRGRLAVGAREIPS